MRPLLCPLLAAALAGCGATRPPTWLTPTGPVVEEVEVEGNERLRDARIESAIATRKTRRFLLYRELHRLDAGALAQDVRRIRDLYEEEGFYAARVEAEVRETGADRVAVIFRVEEGPPTSVRSLVVEGLDALDGEERARLLADAPLLPGDRFVEREWTAWKGAIRERLRELGFADARVDARVEVAPAEGEADLLLLVDTGRRYRFAEPVVVGNLLVPARRIREAARAVLAPGDRYAPSAMAEAQGEVFSLGAFAAVTVTPRREEEAPVARPGASGAPEPGAAASVAPEGGAAVAGEAPAAQPPPEAPGIGAPSAGDSAAGGPPRMVPVIAVTEADFIRLRLGGGVGIDQSFYQARILGEVTHLNLFGGLERLGWSNQIAYRFVNPTANLVGEPGIAGTSTLDFVVPDGIGTRVDVAARVEYERQLTTAFTAQAVSGRLGTPIRFRRWLHLTPSWVVTRFFDVAVFDADRIEPVTPGVRPTLVGDCPAGCTLSYLEQQLVADRRDHPLEPRRGWYASIGLQEGGLGGDFAWLRVRPEVRGYLPLGDTLVFATRLQLGYLKPLRPCAADLSVDDFLEAVDCSPIVVRFFGGGADDFRGMGADRLSPLRAVRVGDRIRYIPLGGNSQFLASAELRWYFAESWSSAFFLDAGDVEPGATEAFAFARPELALGAGIRYRTPVGPARADLGYRFLRRPTIPIDGAPPPERSTLDYFAFFLSIGEAF